MRSLKWDFFISWALALKQLISLILATTQIGLELPPNRPPLCFQMRACNGGSVN